jgi:O-antigen/teichoic acid export membrane protein
VLKDHHSREILKGAAAALVVKVLAAGVGFLLQVVLARMLGATLAGVYFLALAIMTMTATIGRMGFDAAVVQRVSAYSAKDDWPMVKTVYRTAIVAVLISGTVFSGVLLISAGWLSEEFFTSEQLHIPLAIMALAIAPTMLFSVQASALQGLKRIAEASATLSLFAPALTLVVAVVLVPVWGAAGASLSYLLGAFGAALAGIVLWRARTSALRDASRRPLPEGFWSRLRSFFWISVLQQTLLWSSTLMVGYFAKPIDVAIFSAANRTAMLTLFILVAINAIGGPKFSELHDSGDLINLNRVVRRAMALALLAGAPICLVLVLFNTQVMSLFGGEFIQGGDVLVVIAIGIILAVGTGPISQLMLMCGGERQLRHQLLLAVLVNLVANLLLTPAYGALGGAVATAAAFAVQGVFSVFFAQRRFGLFSIRAAHQR